MLSSGGFQDTSELRPLNPMRPASTKSPDTVHRQAGPEWAEAWGISCVLLPMRVHVCTHVCTHMCIHAAALARPAPGSCFRGTRPAGLTKYFPSMGWRLEIGEGKLGVAGRGRDTVT